MDGVMYVKTAACLVLSAFTDNHPCLCIDYKYVIVVGIAYH